MAEVENTDIQHSQEEQSYPAIGLPVVFQMLRRSFQVGQCHLNPANEMLVQLTTQPVTP